MMRIEKQNIERQFYKGEILDFRRNNFDLIRLCAAFQVMFIHSHHHLDLDGFEILKSVFDVFPGVPIFFVISGFLISASIENSNSLFNYYKNRFLRIYPGMWVCFIVSLISVYTFYPPDFRFIDIVPWIISQLTIGQFYNPYFLKNYGVGVLNGSLWTIPVEIQFYILLPVLYSLFKKIYWNNFIFSFFVILLVIVNQYFISIRSIDITLSIKLFGVSVFPYLYIFLIGVFLQKNHRYIIKYLKDKAIFWLCVYTISVFIMNQFGFSTTGNYLNPISATLLALFVISYGYSHTKIFCKILKGNDISYGIYIYHMVIINIFVQLGLTRNMNYLIYAIILTIIMATLSWKLIEKPALKLKSKSVKHYSIHE